MWFSGYPADTPYPPLPFEHFKGFPSSAICPSRVRHAFYACALLLNTARTEHEINLCGAPYELVKTLLVLMTDVISEGSGEHVFCTISPGPRSLTKFKVDEDSSQIKILHIYVRCLQNTCWRFSISVFLSTCNNGFSYQSKASNSSKWNILTNC